MDESNELNEQEKALALIAIARQRNALLEEGLTRSRLENRQPDTFSAGFARPFQALAGAIQGDPVTRENAFRAIRGEPPLPVEEPLPETMAGRMGEVAAESLVTAVPFGLAASRVQRAAQGASGIAATARNIVSDIGQTFKRKPVAFSAVETGLGATSGAGGFYAEQMFPESDAARFVGEILGGTAPSAVSAAAKPVYEYGVKPTAAFVGRGLDTVTNYIPSAAIVKTFVRQTWDDVAKAKDPTTAGGRAAGRFGRARGEMSPEEVLAAMDEDLLPEARILMTPAQLSGVPGLLSLERSLAETTDTLRNKRLEDLERLNTVIRNAFRGPGDISQTQDAIEATRTHYFNILNERVRLAAIKADESVQRMLPELGEEGANRAARRELELAYTDATKQEKQLFNILDQNAVTPTVNVQAQLNILRREAGETGAGSIPDYAIRFFSKKSEGFLGDATTLKEMRNAQSQLRQIARNARQGADPDANLGRIADSLADAITDDLAMAQGSSSPTDLANAINFSREKNNVFSRGSVGKILRTGSDSGDVVPEMLTLTRTLGQMGIEGAQATDDIVNAAAFARERAGYAGSDNIAGALGSFINNEFILSATRNGAVDVNLAQTFLRDNQVVLDRFPEVRSAIESAVASGVARDSSEILRKAGIDTIDDPDVSKAIILMNKGTDAAFNSILASRNSILETRKVIDLLGKDETGEALAGLKQGFFDYLMNKGTVGNTISGNELAAFVDTPKVRGLIDTLYSSQEKTRLYTIIRTAQRADAARTAAPSVEGVTGDKISKAADSLLGILGAAYGRQVSTVLGGATIQIPGMAASLFRDLGAKGLTNPAKRLIVAALNDEQLFRQVVMAQTPDPSAAGQLAPEASRRLNAWAAGALVRAGLGDEEQEETESQQVQPPVLNRVDSLSVPAPTPAPTPTPVPPPQARVQPPTVQTRGVPAMSQPAVASQGAPDPRAREMLQQLYPMDDTLRLA
jgi:hypothetical protein